MCGHSGILFSMLIIMIIFVDTEVSGYKKLARQKRCIVIQKQSGSRPDRSEGADDEDYRRPQPKEPRPDRLKQEDQMNSSDAEVIPKNLLRYLPPYKNKGRLRNRFFRNPFNY